ncbi:MAG: glucohydrolase, partial [Lachnospiraceae bacterium]|nr:glucohydrolase [Lachnospiraceae bacterium]
PWIYQGQEIGMENCKVTSIDEVDDISSIDAYKVSIADGISEQEALHAIEKYGRDNARTPFQWDDGQNAGFTAGTPWLRVNPNYHEINLKAQRGVEGSVYEYYRKLTALRKNLQYQDTIVYGTLVPYLEDRHNVMAYFRKGEDQTLLVIGNYQREAQTLPLPGAVKQVVLTNRPGTDLKAGNGEIHLEGYQAVVLEMAQI